MRRFWLMTAVLAAAAATVTSAATKFSSVWKAPGTERLTFADRKVAALVISDDQSLRMSGEEAMTRELATRGVQTVQAFRLVPREELKDPEKARGWFERAGVDGVVAMRPVSAGTVRTWQPSSWSAPYYGSLWGYWGYGWGSIYDPGYIREDQEVVVETLIFSVPKNALIWAGMSETTNPKDLSRFIHDVIDAAAKEMRKQGLLQKGAS